MLRLSKCPKKAKVGTTAFREWLFSTSTSLFEVLNTTCCILWGFSLFIWGEAPHISLSLVIGPAWDETLGSVAVGLGAVIALYRLSSLPSKNLVVGVLTSCSGLLWLLIASDSFFGFSDPTPSTAVYTLMSLASWATGDYLFRKGAKEKC